MVSERFITFCNILAVSSELVSMIQILFSTVWFVAKQDQDKYHDIAVFCLVSAINSFIQLLHYFYQSYKNGSFHVTEHSVGVINGVMIILHIIPLVWGGIVLAWSTDSPIPMFSYVWPWIHSVICTLVWAFARRRLHESADDPYFRV
jgi:hypothetical protein